MEVVGESGPEVLENGAGPGVVNEPFLGVGGVGPGGVTPGAGDVTGLESALPQMPGMTLDG